MQEKPQHFVNIVLKSSFTLVILRNLALCLIVPISSFPLICSFVVSGTFTISGLVERKWHCSHLYQKWVYFLEQMEPIGLVCRCFVKVGEVKQWIGVNWLWSLHQ